MPVVDGDTIAHLSGSGTGRFLFVVAVAWSLFQLFIASPLAPWVGEHVHRSLYLNYSESRAVHLAFGIFLAFCTYPAFKRSPRDRIPWTNWVWAVAAAGTALYIFVFYGELGQRAGAPISRDIVIAYIGILCVLEGTRRSLGLPLAIVAIVFLAYTFTGPYLPDLIAFRGAGIPRVADHLWLSIEGVFGIAIGVSSTLIFLFVLFGALLDKAGSGKYFIKLAFSLVGYTRGGPAKASVLSSVMFGTISGSIIANIVTTGTFTIPLMKRSGFSSEKAAAVETSASLNGQIMPPVMGASAFLMTEYVGISYLEIIKHAFPPAIMTFAGLFYIVHLEAMKADMPFLRRTIENPIGRRIFNFVVATSGLIILAVAVYYGLGWIKVVFGDYSIFIACALFVGTYLGLLRLAVRYPDHDLGNLDLSRPPESLPTLLSGLHHLLPLVVLIWCLIIERLSPALSIYWAIIGITFILVTQPIISSAFRGEFALWEDFSRGFSNFIGGLANGARSMVPVVMAMAAAGIIVGVVSLSGIGLRITAIVEVIAGDSLILSLIFTAIVTIIIGMGLPTAANYIVVQAVMAPVVVTVAANNGFIVPLIAVHLFVFYFGLLSGVTPPVAVDAFAGAAVARADPIKTCIQAFSYEIRTMVLPFMFIFNPLILLIGVDSIWSALFTITIGVIAMLAFAAGTMGYFITHSKIYESGGLILVAVTLLVPTLWLDRVVPPFYEIDRFKTFEVAQSLPSGALLRLEAKGDNFSGDPVERTVALLLGPQGPSGEDRLRDQLGLELLMVGEKLLIDNIRTNSQAKQGGLDFDWEIVSVQMPSARLAKQWLYVPALLLLVLIAVVQRKRKVRAAPAMTSEI